MKSYLGIPEGYTSSQAYAVSEDGSTIVGRSNNYHGFIWENGVTTELNTWPDQIEYLDPRDMSPDSRVIVGNFSTTKSSIREAFRWEGGEMIGLGHFSDGPLGSGSFANALSDDGETIVGSVDGQEAFIWRSDIGMVRLNTFLEDNYGLDLSDWSLTHATGISGDGLTIVGQGFNPDGYFEGWIATLPPPNNPPIAGAGEDQIVEQDSHAGAIVTLDGSDSYDPDGDTLTYSWKWGGGTATVVSPTIVLPLGTTVITLLANDGTADSKPDTVHITVVDTTAPVISLNGDAIMTLECGIDEYEEPGATVLDICDPSVSVVIDGDMVNTFVCGIYIVTYNATDASGNPAVQVERTVIVQDTIPPVITLNGDSSITLECYVDTYTEPGATVSDDCGAETSLMIAGDEVDATTCGTYIVTYDAEDCGGNLAVQVTRTVVVQDTTPPEVGITFPTADLALQDVVILKAVASDVCGDVVNAYFYILESDGTTIGYEELEAIFNDTAEEWEYLFDTTELPDGYYIVFAKAVDDSDDSDDGWSEIVPFSIRNWAVVELLPASESNKAGRTMPVKFSLRIAEAVDPATPFVYNEGLEIRIYDRADPGTLLQTSQYGSMSTDYRINSISELYITNFKTKREPAEYEVEIWRPRNDFLVGSFTFETVK